MWNIVDRLADIILTNCKGPIVEIGIGQSTKVLAEHAQACGVKMYSCDVKNFSPAFKGHICFIGKSYDFMDNFDDYPALVFLDGCHNSDCVQREVDFFLSRLLIGGVMFMHDTLPPSLVHLSRGRCSDAYKVRQNLENNPHVNCFTWPYTAKNCGLTMVMKNPKCIIDYP